MCQKKKQQTIPALDSNSLPSGHGLRRDYRANYTFRQISCATTNATIIKAVESNTHTHTHKKENNTRFLPFLRPSQTHAVNWILFACPPTACVTMCALSARFGRALSGTIMTRNVVLFDFGGTHKACFKPAKNRDRNSKREIDRERRRDKKNKHGQK